MKRIIFVYLCCFSGLSDAYSIQGTIIAPDRVKNVIVYLEPGKKNQYQPETIIHVISQKDAKFDPDFITAVPNDKVQWLNNEEKEIDHNIFSLSEIKQFDLGLGEPGSVLSETFETAGMLNYYCSVHKTMEGRIVILPSRFFAILDKPGDFMINDIPSGRWTVNVLVFHRRYQALPVALKVNKPVEKVTLVIEKR